MGAWGLGLFQSDHDYDAIGNFSEEANLFKLEQDAVEEIIAQGKKVSMKCDLDRFLGPKIQAVEDEYNKRAVQNAKHLHKKGKLVGELEKVEIHYSIYGRFCSDRDKIREHLDSGILFKMLAKAQKKLKPSYSGAYNEDGYHFILLGACAMTLGCRLPDSTITLMRKHYKHVGLMRDAKKQMERALNEDHGYKIGIPWDFGSLGLKETVERRKFAPQEDRINNFQINVQEPGAEVVKTSPADAQREFAVQMMMMNLQEENKYDQDVCGGCGAEEGEGRAELLQCSKCKRRKYCSEECQAKHWKFHKLLCDTYAKAGDTPGQAHLKIIAEG